MQPFPLIGVICIWICVLGICLCGLASLTGIDWIGTTGVLLMLATGVVAVGEFLVSLIKPTRRGGS